MLPKIPAPLQLRSLIAVDSQTTQCYSVRGMYAVKTAHAQTEGTMYFRTGRKPSPGCEAVGPFQRGFQQSTASSCIFKFPRDAPRVLEQVVLWEASAKYYVSS